MAESSHSLAKRRRVSASEMNKYPVVAGYRIASYASPGKQLTMNEQRIIYHAWKSEYHFTFSLLRRVDEATANFEYPQYDVPNL